MQAEGPELAPGLYKCYFTSYYPKQEVHAMTRAQRRGPVMETALEAFQALCVGSAGSACMLALFALIQLLTQGEVTIFTDNFWFKEG